MALQDVRRLIRSIRGSGRLSRFMPFILLLVAQLLMMLCFHWFGPRAPFIYSLF